MATMGLDFGLESGMNGRSFQGCKMRFHWMLKIDGICGSKSSSPDGSGSVSVLPPSKSARPSLTFKEMEVRHLNEHIYYPMKPDWKPLNLVLYDLKKPQHAVFEWIKQCYDPTQGSWSPALQSNFIRNARLEMYNGCGDVVETWVYENAWPQVVDFGELDFGSSEIVMCDLTLRYVRAFIESPPDPVVEGFRGF